MAIESIDIYSTHSSRQFNEELEALRTDMLTMGGIVERQVTDALAALLQRDTELAQATHKLDDETNRYERQIDESCAQIIARRQPTAVDLRLILSVNRAVVDLERIGDEATRIAKQAIELAETESVGHQEARHIGQLVIGMLKDVLTSFARRDMDLAYSVVKQDLLVDQEYQSAMRSLITFMMEDARNISKIMSVIWILRSLERIGDHICNLAEQLIYQVSGEDVRHLPNEDIADIVK